MELNVRIDKTLPVIVPDAISFETGATREQLRDPALFAYDHHSAEFSPADKGALTCFFEDMILGRPLPLTLATRSVQDIDTLAAIALFLHRDLATHPATPEFIYTVDFAHRLGLQALSHIAQDKAQFYCALRDYFPEKGLSQRELSARVTTAVGWVREYIHQGVMPVLGPAPRSEVRVVDQGTNGFVVAITKDCLWDGWVDLYRMGFLRGVLAEYAPEDRQRILIAKKSRFVQFDLETAARALNQLEAAMGEPAEWIVTRDGLWLQGPAAGTLLLLRQTLEILTRV